MPPRQNPRSPRFDADGPEVQRRRLSSVSAMMIVATWIGLLFSGGGATAVGQDERLSVEVPAVKFIGTPVIRLGDPELPLPELWLKAQGLSDRERNSFRDRLSDLNGRIKALNDRAAQASWTAWNLDTHCKAALPGLRAELDKLVAEYKLYDEKCGRVGPRRGSDDCRDWAFKLNDKRRALLADTTRLRTEILENNRVTEDIAREADDLVSREIAPFVASLYAKTHAARVMAMTGTVFDQDLNGNRRPLTTNTEDGGTIPIHTGPDGAVKLISGEVTVIGGPDTVFHFEARLNSTGDFAFDLQEALHIVTGKVRIVTQKALNRRFYIRQGSWRGGDRGTEMIYDVREGLTTITMLDGELELTEGSAAPTILRTGQRGLIDADNRLTVEEPVDLVDVERQWNRLPGIRDLTIETAGEMSGRSNWRSLLLLAAVLIPVALMAWLLRQRLARPA